MPLIVTPQLQLSERYISNSSPAVAQPSEDYISHLNAGLLLNYPFANGHLESSAFLESTYSRLEYLSNRLNFNQLGNLDYLYHGERWSSEIKGIVVSTRFGDTVAQLNGGVLTPNSEYLQESAGFQGSYLATRQTTLTGNYTFTNNEYSSTNYVNSESHIISSSLGYQFKSSDQIALLGGADIFKYKPGATIKAVTANIQLTHRMGDSTLLRIGTGVGVTTGQSRYWLAHLNYTRNLEDGTIQADLNRGFSSGGGLAGTSVINQQVNVNFSKTLLRALSGNITGNYGISDGILPGSNFHSELWNATVGLTYVLSRSWNSSFVMAHFEQHNTTGSVTASLYSNQVTLMLSSNFTPWRPF